MKVGIVHMYPFPIGMAATNRIVAYSKGLVADKVDVTVYCLNPFYKRSAYTDFKMVNICKTGMYENIAYSFFISPYRCKNNFFHKIQVLFSIFKSFFILNLKLKKKEIDVLIISTEHRFLLKMYSKLCKKQQCKSVFIFDEYPEIIRYNSSKKLVCKVRNSYNKALKDVTAFVAIINKINDFYNKDLQKPHLIFSTITDVSKFTRIFSNEERNQSLCYMGSLNLQKDNVDLIVRAFSLIAPKYPDLHFDIYGESLDRDYKLLSLLIDELHIRHRVHLKGSVSFDKVPTILSSSKILVSSQVNSMRIQGGLSTKLGEYLASGTPVLLSDVGDIRNQVKNEKHLYLVPPNDVEAYAEKLLYILEHYNEALKVAQQGRDYILKNYSHIAMGKKLHNFLKNI